MRISIVKNKSWLPVIEQARLMMPVPIRAYTSCHLVTGQKISETNLIRTFNEVRVVEGGDGRDRNDIAGVWHPYYQSIATELPILYIPEKRTYLSQDVQLVIHELAHVIDCNFLDFGNREEDEPDVPEVTRYAGRNRHERFAEAFCSYIDKDYVHGEWRAHDYLQKADSRITRYFQDLEEQMLSALSNTIQEEEHYTA